MITGKRQGTHSIQIKNQRCPELRQKVKNKAAKVSPFSMVKRVFSIKPERDTQAKNLLTKLTTTTQKAYAEYSTTDLAQHGVLSLKYI